MGLKLEDYMQLSTKELTLIGLFTGIILLMAFVPQLGFIQIGFVALTIIHIPVLIGGGMGGKKVAISLGLAFGLASLSQALLRPVTPVDVLFQNPLVSVLPRFLFGLAIAYLPDLFKFIEEPYTRYGLSFALATFLHTVLVLSSVYVFAPLFDNLGEFAAATPYFGLITSVLVANGLFEILAAIFIAAPVAVRVNSAIRG
jgi:uncharacterized membrane protein